MAQQNQKPEDMGPFTGHMITGLAFVVPMAGCITLGLVLGNWNTATAFAITWTGFFMAATLRFIRKRTFVVLERFGYFWRVKFAGPRIIIPFIDVPILRDDFLQKSVKLFEGMNIDFTNVSVPVDAAAWYQIGDPDAVESGNIASLTQQVLFYTYRIKAEERISRVAEIFRSSFRSRLETKTLSEAEAQAESLAREAIEGIAGSREGAKNALAEIGVYPFPGKGIIVSDFALTPEAIRLREQRLRGEAEAMEAVNRSRAYWEPLVEMKRGLQKENFSMSDERIVDMFMTRIGFEIVQKTGSNVSFVAPGLKGVLATMDVNAKKQTD